MRNTERGGSQIPLVICIVLLLVAGFFAYDQYGKAESANASLAKILNSAKDEGSPAGTEQGAIRLITYAKGPGIAYKTRLDEMGDLIGSRDEENPDLVVSPSKVKALSARFLEALDKGEFTVDFPTPRYIADPAGGIKVSDDGNNTKIAYSQTAKALAGAKADLSAIIDVVTIPAMRRMVADIKSYRDNYATQATARETLEKGYKETIAAKDGEIRSKIEELSALEGRKAQAESDLRKQLGDAEAAKAASEEEKTKSVAALTAERNDWKKKAEQAGSEVTVLKQKKRQVETDTSPDGKVVTADSSQGMVVIDLGKSNNNLMAGTNFEVYAIGKGGREVPKGTVKVSKVDANTSTAAVLELYDAYNPIAQGDLIRSLIYNPKEVIHVAMVGRFMKMGKSDAARRLESLGVVVDDKVGVHTNYLVVGEKESEAQPIEETPEYKTATLYGIPFLSEKELSRLTMY